MTGNAWFLLAAYLLLWAIVFVYVIWLQNKIGTLREQLETLEEEHNESVSPSSTDVDES